MDANEIKERLKDNTDKIIDLLESLNCHSIQHRKNRITCARPDGDNKGAIRIKTDTLGTRVFTGDIQTQGSIIDFIMEFKDYNLPQA